jgi:hypothetical protein
MTLENEVADGTDTKKPVKPKENFLKGLWKDWFYRKDDPNYGRNYGLGILRMLAIGGMLFGYFHCDMKMKEAKVRELPSTVVRIEDILNNKSLRTAIVNHYVPDIRLQRYALEEMERRNANNKDPNTLIVPYVPDK